MHPLARSSEVVVRYGNHAVALRPSLRAAITLERLHGGWEGLILRLSQLDTQTVWAIMRASAVSGPSAEALLHSLANRPLAEIKEAVAEPLGELLGLFLAPLDAEPTDAPQPATAKPKPWSEAYAELFRIGTGWLGWTPAETWAATPLEIAQAFEGHVAKLKAIHGTGEADTPTGPTEEQRAANIAAGLDPDFDRAGLRALKGKL